MVIPLLTLQLRNRWEKVRRKTGGERRNNQGKRRSKNKKGEAIREVVKERNHMEGASD